MEAKARIPVGARVAAYLKTHPVITLLILTPGIPEYLSSSSPINAIVLNPPQFVFQLLANLGLYGSGALLIHDAGIRWKKGWATVLLLGAAYGILEEGVALSTLFDPNAGPVGALGSYGHWLGVNLIWAAGIVPFHAIFSISIPILLLGIAIPETRLKPLVSTRGTIAALLVLSFDVVILMVVVWHVSGYWMGWPILALSFLSIGGLLFLSRRITLPFTGKMGGRPTPSSKEAVAVGFSFFPAVILVQNLGRGAGLPAALDFLLVVAVQALYLLYVTRRSWGGSRKSVISFVLGLLVPIMVFGVLAELAFPLTLLADLVVVVFFRRLWVIREGPEEMVRPSIQNRLNMMAVKGRTTAESNPAVVRGLRKEYICKYDYSPGWSDSRAQMVFKVQPRVAHPWRAPMTHTNLVNYVIRNESASKRAGTP